MPKIFSTDSLMQAFFIAVAVWLAAGNMEVQVRATGLGVDSEKLQWWSVETVEGWQRDVAPYNPRAAYNYLFGQYTVATDNGVYAASRLSADPALQPLLEATCRDK